MAASKSVSAQVELAECLVERRDEIEQTLLTRVYAVSDPGDVNDPAYREGLRAAVAAAIDYALAGVESPNHEPPPVPPVLLSQARLAAQSKVGLDTVLRRYFAGYTLLGDFLIEEAQAIGPALRGEPLKRVLRSQAALFDRLIVTVSEEHEREAKARAGSTQERFLKRIEQLLEGKPRDTSDIPYDFEATHVALLATGEGETLTEPLRELAARLDRRLLLVSREDTVEAWLGGRSGPEYPELAALAATLLPHGARLTIGEPATGIAGWRHSHRQARAALPIALRGEEPIVRYADVALLATVLKDELLVSSLREMYLEPLEREPDGGELTRRALRAYFASGCNVSSAAAASGLNRNTVAKRIRDAEEAIGRPLASCAAEYEAALKLIDFVPR